MKISYLLFGAALCGFLTSCFKDEPLNAECDIEQAYVHIDNPTEVFFAESDTLVNVLSNSTDITFRIKAGSDVSAIAPQFRITEGATVSPASGSMQDFSDGKTVTYTVTSQDGKWQRKYNVRFTTYNPISKFDFENFKLVDGENGGQYYQWTDLNPDGSEAGNWATGNGGFNISMSSAAADEYPTTPAEGHTGQGVKLVTSDTGPLGNMPGLYMPIAAGNIFLGYFDVSKALTATMQATNFGLPFDRKPLRLTGWYKYHPGEVFIDRYNNVYPDRTDIGDIYAVLYLNHDDDGNAFVLHGDDVKTSKQIVAIAQVPEILTTDEWTSFDVEFKYSAGIDEETLINQGYSLAVVATSSIEGASFNGAIGSTLYVDEIEVIWDDTNEQP